jgi:hypothetical protein
VELLKCNDVIFSKERIECQFYQFPIFQPERTRNSRVPMLLNFFLRQYVQQYQLFLADLKIIQDNIRVNKKQQQQQQQQQQRISIETNK